MEFVWAHGPSTAEQVRDGLRQPAPDGRSDGADHSSPAGSEGVCDAPAGGTDVCLFRGDAAENVAMRTIRHIIDRFWGGSAQALVAGMVEQEVIDPAELRELSRRLRRPHKRQQEK